MLPIPVILVGLDHPNSYDYMGHTYDDQIKFVGVVESDAIRRQRFCDVHHIPPQYQFTTWQDWLDRPPFADVAIVMTPAESRIEIAQHATHCGYTILTEPPLGKTADDVFTLLQMVAPKTIMIAHSLRYTGFFRAAHGFLKKSKFGKIRSYHHEVKIPYADFVHNYVRTPNQHREAWLLSQGIHEIDLMRWLLDEPAKIVKRTYDMLSFTPNAAPLDAFPPMRCIDNCPIEKTCDYSAIQHYDQNQATNHDAITKYLAKQIALPESVEEISQQAVWGDCAYHKNLHMIGNQTLEFTMESGVIAKINMALHAQALTRSIHIVGEQGQLKAVFAGTGSTIIYTDAKTQKDNVLNFRTEKLGLAHSMMGHIMKVVRGETDSLTWLEDVIEAHYWAHIAQSADEQPVNIESYLDPST